jgi:hypothetical protein
MHVVRNKKSGKVIYIDYAPSASLQQGKEVYERFDEKTMEIGWADKTYLPAYYSIDKSGKIVESGLEEAVKSGQLQLAPDQKLVRGKVVNKTTAELVHEKLLKLEDVKKRAIDYHSALAFSKRRELIPDYKLENAALGIYEEGVVGDLRATVKAFRDEFYRIKTEIEKSKTADDVEAVKTHYPASIVSVKQEKQEKQEVGQQVEKTVEKEAQKEKREGKKEIKKAAKKSAKKKTTK